MAGGSRVRRLPVPGEYQIRATVQKADCGMDPSCQVQSYLAFVTHVQEMLGSIALCTAECGGLPGVKPTPGNVSPRRRKLLLAPLSPNTSYGPRYKTDMLEMADGNLSNKTTMTIWA